MSSNYSIKKLFELLKGGREWYILLFSLLLAFFIWLLHNLSQEYSVFLNYNVTINSNFEGRAQVAKSDDILILRGKTTGFYAIANKLSRENIILEVDNKALIQVKNVEDLFMINPDAIKSDIFRKLGNEVAVEFITTDVLTFDFPKVSSKKVPIDFKTTLSFKSQYMSVSAPIIRPDSVTVFANPEILESVRSVSTEMLTLKNISNNEQGMVNLICPVGVSLSENNIYYSISSSRYIEKSILLPVYVKNNYSDKKLLAIPSHVKISYRQSYNSQKNYEVEDFRCVIDYNKYLNSISSNVIPDIEKMPDGVFSVRLEPKFVECTLVE